MNLTTSNNDERLPKYQDTMRKLTPGLDSPADGSGYTYDYNGSATDANTTSNMNNPDAVYDELVEDINTANIIEYENYVRKQIEVNYPIRYVIVDSVLMITLNVCLIALQIVACRNNAAMSYLASAIWAALYNLVVVGMVLATIKYRNSTLVMLTSNLKLFGMIISFVGFILINLVAFYHYNCQAASYYRNCYNEQMKPVHYAIILLGIPCLFLSIVFFIYFQFKLLGRARFNRPMHYTNENYD